MRQAQQELHRQVPLAGQEPLGHESCYEYILFLTDPSGSKIGKRSGFFEEAEERRTDPPGTRIQKM
jgi:hypothetical protein